MEEQKKLMGSLMRQCSRREYCTADIVRKIRTYKARAAAAEEDGTDRCAGENIDEAEILRTLREEGYLSDERYACAFARDKASLEGWGPVKIRYALRARGIDESIIRNALEDVDAGAADRRMETVLAAKYRSLKEDPDCRLKLLRYALGRGYAYEDVARVVERLTGGGE